MPTDFDEPKNLPIPADLPDAENARRFLRQLAENHPADFRKLTKKTSLLSDVLAIVAFSPLLATTLLQNPAYIFWLDRQRDEPAVPSKEDLLESLARFSLTNSQIEPQILLSRFRRRELLRIYLRDIRKLGTIAETTEEISNLADAILEYALQIARQEMDNRYGIPLEINDKQREKPAQFCVVSLGKLGSRELNYSSDIDLLFLYSSDGTTSGQGSRGAITNREYFVKLAETLSKIVGQQTGEGAAYRVDLRLRPHGRVGALAVSISEATNYYKNQAQAWERQTLIRARASAGDPKVFREFWKQLETSVYSPDETIENALRNVKLSKEKINLEHATSSGYNVKLGQGGIREIEFIAQALQLAYGGRDRWLRAPHPLISLSRLSDRKILSETELTKLVNAYDFLRRLEHRLQMEHGLQTHLIPDSEEKKSLIAQRMNFRSTAKFDAAVALHTQNVSRIFTRVFGDVAELPAPEKPESVFINRTTQSNSLSQVLTSVDKSSIKNKFESVKFDALSKLTAVSPHFAALLSINPRLVESLPAENEMPQQENYESIFTDASSRETSFRQSLAALRVEWTKAYLRIAAFDIYEKIDVTQAKRLQTKLAEAALGAALKITQREIFQRFQNASQTSSEPFQLAVLGLGKLGSRGMDYGSDLDLVLVYDDENPQSFEISPAEFYSRAADIFVTTLSSFTREGNLYRVDLRLRPDGKNGTIAVGQNAFLNYLETRAAIWEWLAYVKLRGVAGEINLASETEQKARRIIHANSRQINRSELQKETIRVREMLTQKRHRGTVGSDIKYDAGGLLDIYFATRFLQLRDNLPDDSDNRSTQYVLNKLFENQSLNEENYMAFAEGHRFLNLLDHNLRLTIGRSNSLPLADKSTLQIIAARMNLENVSDLLEKLALHRLEIHTAYENVLNL